LKIGDSYFEKFYHHIFETDKEIVGLLKELALEDKLVWKSGKTGTYYQGKITQLDSPFSVLKYSPLRLVDRLRLGLVLGYLKITRNYGQFEKVTATSWLKKYMGERAYNIIWEPLLKGKFQENFDQITMSWFWARIFARTSKLGYLKGGFYQLYQRLAEEIKSRGGKLILGETVEGIKEEKGKIKVSTQKKTYEFDKVLVTLPTNLFFNLTPQLSFEFKARYQWQDYFGAQTLVLTLKKKVTDYYWVNISDPGFPFLVFVEHTNFIPPSDYGGAHLIYLGNYFNRDDPRFKMSDKATFEAYFPYLKKLNPDFEKEWVLGYQLFRAPFAQPIVKVGYRDHLPPSITGIPNLYLANMAQVYPWDRGQNYSIKLASEVVEKYFK
jgi:protoporphyrinogen oxidase